MRVESKAYQARPFRPRLHATLPEAWTKNSLLTLVFGIAHQIGLNATDVMVLRRLALKTRAPDYADQTRSPICFERQVFNDVGATQAMVYPEPTARRNETFMLFGAPGGTQGNVVSAGTNELVLPNYKQTWANIRKLADAGPSMAKLSFKSWEVTL